MQSESAVGVRLTIYLAILNVRPASVCERRPSLRRRHEHASIVDAVRLPTCGVTTLRPPVGERISRFASKQKVPSQRAVRRQKSMLPIARLCAQGATWRGIAPILNASGARDGVGQLESVARVLGHK